MAGNERTASNVVGQTPTSRYWHHLAQYYFQTYLVTATYLFQYGIQQTHYGQGEVIRRSREHTCPCLRVCTLRCRCDAPSG